MADLSTTVSDSVATSERIDIIRAATRDLTVSDSTNVSESYEVSSAIPSRNFIGITFDSNSLQTTNIVSSEIDHESTPEAAMAAYSFPHSPGTIIPSVTFNSKPIHVTGTIFGTGLADTDSRLKSFKALLTGQAKNLDFDYDNSTLRYICTAKHPISITRPNNLAWASYDIEFTALSPFGQNVNLTAAISDPGRTSGSYQDTHTFLGGSPYQYPIFTVTLNSVTGGTAARITIGNDSTGQSVAITRTWSNADILIIDSFLGTIQVNGVDVDFAGAFPVFALGAGVIDYSDNFTTRNFDYNVSYYKRYL